MRLDAKRLRPIQIAAVVLLVLIIAAMIALRPRTSSVIRASGTIEATESEVSPRVEGRLVQLRVHDGDPVRAGEIVGVLGRRDLSLSVDQAAGNVAAAQARVAAARALYSLQLATYGTTLAQAFSGERIARNQVAAARAARTAALATYEKARIDYARASNLVATGDEARAVLDAARAAYTNAYEQLHGAGSSVNVVRAQRAQSQAAVQSARAQMQQVRARYAEVQAARGQLAQARSALSLAQRNLGETLLRAPFDGFVLSHNFEVGDLVQPGSAVMTIGDLAHPYLYVYVSESDLPRIKTGMRADVSLDGMPNRIFVGTVTEISNTAEFTPENVQTKAERIEYLVFRVKIQFTDTTQSLKPGLPADAVIRV